MVIGAAFRLAIVTALAYTARSFLPSDHTETGSGATLAFGFLLVAALQIGHIADRVRFPHLTGYLLCGLVFGPEVLGIVSRAMIADLALIKGTAVGLIALLAGCELNFRKLRESLKAIASISIASMSIVAVVLWGVFFWIASVMPVSAAFSTLERAAIALVCANVLAAFSPSVVIGLINETKASGPLSRLCMSIVVVADLAMVLLFSLTSMFARNVFPEGAAAGGFAALVQHIFGSIVAGLAVGALLAIYIKRVNKRTGLLVFALLFIVAEAGRALHLDPLLVGLAAGLLLENASPVGGEQVAHAVEPVTLPTFAIFFAVVGAEIHLHAFLQVAPFALAAAAVRAVAIFAGTFAGGRFAGVEPRIGRLVPFGLLPQAGVAIALATLVLNSFPPWGAVFGTVLLGSIVVNELVGPILFRMALSRAGEITISHHTESGDRGDHKALNIDALPGVH